MNHRRLIRVLQLHILSKGNGWSWGGLLRFIDYPGSITSGG